MPPALEMSITFFGLELVFIAKETIFVHISPPPLWGSFHKLESLFFMALVLLKYHRQTSAVLESSIELK